MPRVFSAKRTLNRSHASRSVEDGSDQSRWGMVILAQLPASRDSWSIQNDRSPTCSVVFRGSANCPCSMPAALYVGPGLCGAHTLVIAGIDPHVGRWAAHQAALRARRSTRECHQSSIGTPINSTAISAITGAEGRPRCAMDMSRAKPPSAIKANVMRNTVA